MNRIVAARVPGMTTAKPFHAKRCSLYQSIFVNRLCDVNRTTWEEATCLRQEWRNESVIDTQDTDHDLGKKSYHERLQIRLSVTYRLISLATCKNESLAAPGLAMISISRAGTIWWFHCRKHSRSNRFIRLRTTALPTFELTVIPKRASDRSVSLVMITKLAVCCFLPERERWMNSGRFLRRACLGKPAPTAIGMSRFWLVSAARLPSVFFFPWRDGVWARYGHRESPSEPKIRVSVFVWYCLVDKFSSWRFCSVD